MSCLSGKLIIKCVREYFLEGFGINRTYIKLISRRREVPLRSRELKKISRSELIELLYELELENQKIRELNNDIQIKLDSKELIIKNSGSIAEAALKLNGVFDAAEKAAQQYLDNISDLDNQSSKIINQAKKEAEEIIKKAKEEAALIQDNAKQKLEEYFTKIQNTLLNDYKEFK